MTVYVENPKESTTTKKLLELISDYGKVSGYKDNMQKSITSLYTSNEQVKFKIKKRVAFTLAPKRIKYLGLNIAKYVQDLYEENYKTLMKEIKKLNGKIFQVHG